MTEPRIRRRPITDYTNDPFNPNEGTPEGRDFVAHSIDSSGLARSAVASADDSIVAGNKTLEAAKAAGVTDVIEVTTTGDELVIVKREDWTDIDSPDARRYAYMDNRASQLGLRWDPSRIALDHARGIDLKDIFDKETLATMLHRARRRLQPDRADNAPDMPDYAAKWGTALGQIWTLGEHRLAVGSCTDTPLLARLAAGSRANLIVTSPPYWVGKPYEQETSREEIAAFIADCAYCWEPLISRAYGRIIINTGTCSIHNIEHNVPVEILPLIDYWTEAFRAQSFLLRHMRLWLKSSELATARVAARTDTVSHGQFEYLLDFQADAFVHSLVFYDPDEKQRGQNKLSEPWTQQAVWSDIPGDRNSSDHGAAFPREIPSRYIRLYTTADELVFDPFGGSGTTLLVCQELGRRCLTVELDANYAALILDRFHEEAGIMPVLAGE